MAMACVQMSKRNRIDCHSRVIGRLFLRMLGRDVPVPARVHARLGLPRPAPALLKGARTAGIAPTSPRTAEGPLCFWHKTLKGASS